MCRKNSLVSLKSGNFALGFNRVLSLDVQWPYCILNLLNMKVLQFLKDWTLPLAILVGAVGYRYLTCLDFMSPILIFFMLLLTFSKMSLKDLKFSMLHLWLLLIEIGGAVVVYYAVLPIDEVAAQGAMVCMICPTATAAAVVTGKLGGNAGSITAYTLLSNMVVAVAVPLLFPLLTDAHEQPSFLMAFLHILKKIFPLLICPFIVAQLMRRYLPKLNRRIASVSGLAFYLWAVAITIAMAQAMKAFFEQPHDGKTGVTELLLALMALLTCAIQFFAGKMIGRHYNDTIAGGQSLGQKNTILAIWMCNSYLNPLSSLGPGAYIVWQNCFNSWQLWRKRKADGNTDFRK